MYKKNRIEEMMEQLTLEEKIGMVHGAGFFQSVGVDRLGIPPLRCSDGTMGVRYEFETDEWRLIGNGDDLTTYLPSDLAIASTWNPSLAKLAGEVLGQEARGRGKDVILAPGINVIRSPLCGRNFEYMSEDPYLISEICVPFIQGVQQNDVAVCVKHYAGNNQENNRMNVEAVMDDQTLYEIYLPAFEAAVKRAKAYSIMGAYNKFRGEYCCESKLLLKEILRKQWGFDGVVISDWGGVHHTEKAANAGLDLEMSIYSNFDEYYFARPLKQAIQEGRIEEACLDYKVRNILTMMEHLHCFDESRCSGSYNTKEQREQVLEIANESIVLLKNDEKILPMRQQEIKKLLVIGENAIRVHGNGGGSAEVTPLYEITPLMGLKSQLGGNVEVEYVKGYRSYKINQEEGNWQETSLEEDNSKLNERKWISQEQLEENQKLREIAMQKAAEHEQVILVVGLNHDYDVEGLDREDMKLPYEQDALIEGVLEKNPNAIIVVIAGAPVEMGEWIDKAKTVLWMSYNGMEGGNALANIVLGKVNPSGKLPISFPKKHMDCPAHCIGEFGNAEKDHFKEGIFVGYRYYDTYEVEPQFCFGHGLSYTTFTFGELKEVNKRLENYPVVMKVTIKNTGERAGAEVVQLYIEAKDSKEKRPKHELKGLRKVFLQPGEEQVLEFSLEERAFQYYNQEEGRWERIGKKYNIQIGNSSRNIYLQKEIEIE